MAYAGYRYTAMLQIRRVHVALTGGDRFTRSVIKAVKGEKGIIEPSYVYLPGVEGGDAIAKEVGVDFFSVPIELGVCSQLQRIGYLTKSFVAFRSRIRAERAVVGQL